MLGLGKLSCELEGHLSPYKKWKKRFAFAGTHRYHFLCIHSFVQEIVMYFLPCQEVCRYSGTQRQAAWPVFSKSERWQFKSQIRHSEIYVVMVVSTDVWNSRRTVLCVFVLHMYAVLKKFSLKWCLIWIFKDTEGACQRSEIEWLF